MKEEKTFQPTHVEDDMNTIPCIRVCGVCKAIVMTQVPDGQRWLRVYKQQSRTMSGYVTVA